MEEQFLHFVWKYRLFNFSDLKLSTGEDLEILYQGEANSNAGPDFSRAKLRIAGIEWVGNVEIHVNEAEWFQHKHHEDPAYNNVILHVVYEPSNKAARTENGHELPTLYLQHRIPGVIYNKYVRMKISHSIIPCAAVFVKPAEASMSYYFKGLLSERLADRQHFIQSLLNQHKFDWEKVSLIMIARGFGQNVNADAMHQLMESFDHKILSKLGRSIFHTEALLFGQAGFLEEEHEDIYFFRLQKEYRFMQLKYALVPLNVASWKFSRMRPAAFPTIRIAQLAALVCKEQQLFDNLVRAFATDQTAERLQIRASEYWSIHFNFGKRASQRKDRILGQESIEHIMVNALLPMLYTYAGTQDDDRMNQRVEEAFDELAPEKNLLINNWKKLGITPGNAGEAQSLLYLHHEYCKKLRCLECKLGCFTLSHNAQELMESNLC